jgi:hypothetical protein
VYIVPGRTGRLILKGPFRFVPALDGRAISFLDHDAVRLEGGAHVLVSERRAYPFFVRVHLHGDVLKDVRPAFDVPDRTGDGQVDVDRLDGAPAFEADMAATAMSSKSVMRVRPGG